MLKPNSAAPLALAGSLGGLVGALAMSLLVPVVASSTGAPAFIDTELRSEFAGLRKDLGALIVSLQARPLALPSGVRESSSQRDLVGAVDPGLAPALASLEETLREFMEARAIAPSSAQIEVAPLQWGTPAPPNWDARREAGQAIDKDYKAEFPKYFGLSSRQLYLRFGPPDETSVKEGSLYWYYTGQGENESMCFTLLDGMVVNVSN